MRPSMWIIPSLISARARRPLVVGPSVNGGSQAAEGEFLTGAIGAHEVVLKNFAANDMRALGAMLTDRALAAFRDAFIENLIAATNALAVDVEREWNPIIVELSIRINDEVPDARAEEVMERVRASISSYGGAARGWGVPRGRALRRRRRRRLGSVRRGIRLGCGSTGEVQQPGAVDDDGQGERA